MTKQDWKDAYKDIIVVDIWGTKLRDKHTSLGLKYTQFPRSGRKISAKINLMLKNKG